MLKELHPDFQVLAGSTNDKTAGVFFRGERLFTIPNNQIYEHPLDTYGVQTSNGFVRHRTITDAMAMAKHALAEIMHGGDDADAIMGGGKFSEAALKAGDEQHTLADDQDYEAKQKQTKGGIFIP